MNILKRMLGSGQKDELASIPSGQLILFRSPGSPKSESECLYNDAVASIRQTTNPYHYQLVIQKAYQEGEEQLKDDEENDDSLLDELESSDERTFLIHEELCFYKSINGDGNTIIVWKDVSGDEGDKFAFVCDTSMDEGLIQHFLDSIYRYEYEIKYSKSSLNATDDDLQEFKFDPSKEVLSQGLLGSDLASDEDDSEDVFDDAQYLPEPQGEVVGTFACSLFEFDAERVTFVLKSEDFEASVVASDGWIYYLVAKSEGKLIHLAIISQDINPTFNYESLSFLYNHQDENHESTFLYKFADFDKLSEFQSSFIEALWESKNKTKWGKIKADDKDYLIDTFGDMKLDDEDEGDEEDSDIEEVGEEEFDEPEVANKKTYVKYDAEEADENAAELKFSSDKEKNKELSVSYLNDRSYVVRGSKIGVFKSKSDDEGLEFYAAIDSVKNSNGKVLTPDKVMLHEKDTALVLQDSKKLSSLYKLDLTKGKVVEEYGVSKDEVDFNVVQFNQSQKFAQMTAEQTFLGIGSNGLFRIDPRLSTRNKLVESECALNAKNPGQTALASTASGGIAVAQKDGVVKLFDRVGIRAKTRLPGLGQAIIGLDVSPDGKWVLATCETYLLLIEVLIKDGKNEGRTGFQASFSKGTRPQPKILQLLPQHAAIMKNESGKALKFTIARFNTGIDTKETSIITSSGPYVIRWNFKKALRGDREPYLIKRYNLEITGDNFRFGTDKDIIVSFDNDVTMLNKKKFSKLTPSTLARK